jgi:hypothetical protein
VVALLAAGPAAADPAAPEELPSAADLDGWYLTIGPIGAATHVGDGWWSAAGGELSVVHLGEAAFPAVAGACVGGVSYGGRPGGRLWLEAEAGMARPLPFGLGLAAGLAVEVDRTLPTRLGAQATLWAGAGFVPYVRVGFLDVTGKFAEAGIMLKVPVRFAY